ncbi:MAG: hypothetical protein WC050_02295 [Candidatus Paceibacterota bacterium]
MQDEIELDGVTYAPLRHVAEDVNLSREYLSRLFKKGIIDARKVKNEWYVNRGSVKAYLLAQTHARDYRRKNLARQRSTEYQKNLAVRKARPDEKTGAALVKTSITYAADVRDHVRNVIQEKSVPGLVALSESARTPGALHAAAGLSARALVHIPTYAVSPTMDLVHRVVSLVGAFVLVFGAYSFFDKTYMRVAYESVGGMTGSAFELVGNGKAAIVEGSRSSIVALERFADHPSIAIERARVTMGSLYGSVRARAQGAVQNVQTAMPASAALSERTPAIAMSDTVDVAAEASTADLAAAGVVGMQGIEPTAPSGFGEPVAVAIQFSGSSVAYGDIVAFDPATQRYTIASGSGDAKVFGVAVRDPVLLFRPDGAKADISVVRSGSALINVTLENGPIAVGDRLTSSSIQGKARKAKSGEYIIGFAKEAFTGGGITLRAPDGSSVPSGTITVNVDVGGGSSAPKVVEPSCATFWCQLAKAIDPEVVRALVRYLLSGIIAALTLTFAFKSFMSDANYGVISIGRNPRAKSSIQSLVFFNALLALAIASTGLFAAMIVLFAG